MAGTIAITNTVSQDISRTKRETVYTIVWTGDAANGSVPALAIPVVGRIEKIQTNPGGTAPTDNYTIKLFDPNIATLDVLQAKLVANQKAASAVETYVYASGAGKPVLVGYPGATGLAGPANYSLQVSLNVVNSATATIIMYVTEAD